MGYTKGESVSDVIGEMEALGNALRGVYAVLPPEIANQNRAAAIPTLLEGLREMIMDPEADIPEDAMDMLRIITATIASSTGHPISSVERDMRHETKMVDIPTQS